MSEFGKWTEVKKTRKEHQCKGCLIKIPAGSGAKYFAGRVEGEFSTGYLCKECDKYLREHSKDFEDFWHEGEIGELRREAGYRQADSEWDSGVEWQEREVAEHGD
ncbi:MAG: hypothetical protein M0021_09585 [Clostridia bacterium]|nr:hypothetical protein [Clostridia bacterium]